jgi:hypothetical protein
MNTLRPDGYRCPTPNYRRVNALSELCLFWGAEERVRRWAQAVRTEQASQGQPQHQADLPRLPPGT